MNKLIIFFLLFFLVSCDNSEDQSCIRDTFDTCRKSIIHGDYQQATNCLDTKSIAYYGNILNLIRTADSTKLKEHSLLDQLSVLLLRALATKPEIDSFDAKSLFTFCLKEGLVDKNDIVNAKISKVVVEDSFAVGYLINDNIRESINKNEITEEDAPKLNFYKEGGKWKFSLVSIIEQVEPIFKKQLIDQNMNENDFLMGSVMQKIGEEPNLKIWEPK